MGRFNFHFFIGGSMKKFMLSLLAATLVVLSAHAAPPTVTFTASATSGQSPLTTTLTWSSIGASNCSAAANPANSQWTGAKALSGSATLTGITADTALVLSCGTAGDLNATFTWLPPTLNTDGTTLTDLASYKIYECVSATSCTVVASPAVPAISAQAGPFTVGLHTFQMTAINSLGTESVPSNSVQKTFTDIEITTKTLQVTVSKKTQCAYRSRRAVKCRR